MANLIVKATDFSPSSQMFYGKPRVNTKGGKSISITNGTTKRVLMLHTPMMLTYGVNNRVNDDGTTTYDMSLQFPRDEFANKDTQELKRVMAEMEEKIIQDAFANSRDWFGKKYNSIDVLRELWTPMLKYPKNKDDGSLDTSRSPTLKVKLPFWDGQAKFDLFDVNSRSIYPNDNDETPDVLVQKGSNVYCVLMCGGIWFASGKFGVTWKLNQAIVKPPEAFEKGKCYVALAPKADYDSDGESESPKSEPPKMEEVAAEPVPVPVPEPEPSVSETEVVSETSSVSEPVETKQEPAAKPEKEKKEKKSSKKAAE
jgi:hypothetical protein